MKKKAKTLTPKLRFPEFKNGPGWDTRALEYIAERMTTRNSDGAHSRVLTNSAERGVLDQRDYFEREIVSAGSIDTYYVVERGDYVYNPRTSASAPVGPISRNNLGTGVMSPLYTVFRFTEDDTDFYEHYFKSAAWHSYLRSVSSTGARHDRMSITSSAFMQMPVPTPHPAEQRKIAACLTSLEEWIAAEERKLETLRAHKKGLLQQLFPREGETCPRLRFPEFRDNWQKLSLTDVCYIQRGKFTHRPRNDPKFFDGPYPFIQTGDVVRANGGAVSASQSLNDLGLSVSRLFEPPMVLITIAANIGDTAILERRACFTDSVVGLTPKEHRVTHRFLEPLLRLKKDYLNKVATTGAQKNINNEILGALEILVPSHGEQKRIATCLSSLDALIAAQTRKLDGLQAHKMGLLQQLFPSPETTKK
jgi:type I restriction enzyme S subunit